MNWKQERIEDINKRILEKIRLLKECEKELDSEVDPIRRYSLKVKIKEINEDIKGLDDEIERYENSIAPTENSESTDDSQNKILEEKGGINNPEENINAPEQIEEDIYEKLSEEEIMAIEELRRRLEEAKGKTFTFLLIGKTGAGKSSTINSLMGADVAPIGEFDPCTTNVTVHETNLHGVTVRVIDTPGLCDQLPESGNDIKYIDLIRQKISYPVDAVLYVSHLDYPRVDASEIRGMQLITAAFGDAFWKKAVIVFTRMDKVKTGEINRYLEQRTKRIHAKLLELDLSKDIIEKIPSVTVDNTNLNRLNPDGQKWIENFYLTILDRVEDSSKDVLLLSTSHMLEKIGVTPLSVMEKVSVAGIAGNSAIMGASLASVLGVGATSLGAIGPGGVPAGLLLISNPAGWAIVLGSAAIGGAVAYGWLKKSKNK